VAGLHVPHASGVQPVVGGDCGFVRCVMLYASMPFSDMPYHLASAAH
jgi:hypothetical protein